MARVVLRSKIERMNLELGDYVVLNDDRLRQVIKVNGQYMLFDPEEGIAYFPAYSSIDFLASKKSLTRIIKKDDMELREL